VPIRALNSATARRAAIEHQAALHLAADPIFQLAAGSTLLIERS
jgi:hypothetical protein